MEALAAELKSTGAGITVIPADLSAPGAAAALVVGTGIVASLARPGGNITGLSGQAVDTAGKRIELLRDLIPDLRRLAILADDSPLVALDADEVQGAARDFALETATFDIRRSEAIH